MAAPAWATDLTTFWLQGATTVTALGGGAAGLGNPEADFFIQDTECLSKQAWTNAVKGFIVDALGANFTVPTDGAVVLFAKFDAAGSLDSKANGGLRVVIGSANNAYYHYYVGGKTTLAFDSWVPYVIDPNTATADNTTGSPSGSERWVGILANLPTTAGPTKGNPIAIDAVRYGRCRIDYTLGDSGTPNSFVGCEAYANDPTRRWGLIELLRGSYIIQGFHSIGTSGTACYFRSSNRVFFWRAAGANNLSNDAVSNDFNRIEILNSGSDVVWDNLIFQALGTRARGRFYHTAGAFTATNCQFVSTGLMSLLSTSVLTDCVMRSTGVITAPGSTLNGSKILTSEAAADASALVWGVSTDPDGKLDNMQFSKGTNAHHAISLATPGGDTITLRGIAFSGFNASDSQNDSTLYFTASSGTITVNLVGCSGNISYKSAGATVNFVVDPVTLSVHVQDANTGNPISGARVWVPISEGGHGKPYLASVTITRSGSTATVSHSTHGLSTNDYVWIQGADQVEYNGTHQITKIDANSYSFTVSGTPATPATGTITSTFVVISTTTDGSGDATGVYSYSSSQPVSGRVRTATGAGPYYKTAPVTGTISSTSGLSVTVQMIPDT